VASLVGQLSNVLDGSDSKHYVLVQQGAAIVLYGISSIIGLVATGLLVFCLYDVIAHWFHAMRFHKCQTKVRRVHEAFLSRQGELSLCPYCVTSVSNQPSSSHVVFLCGHRFHMECANRWFAEEPQHSGQCAICAGGSKLRLLGKLSKAAARASALGACDGSEPEGEGLEVCELPRCCSEVAEQREGSSPDKELRLKQASLSAEEKLDCNRDIGRWSEVPVELLDCKNAENDADDGNSSCQDEAKNFMLHSLYKEYPDIIQQACLARWCSCHTEIWLSELHCPRYKSIFAKQTQK